MFEHAEQSSAESMAAGRVDAAAGETSRQGESGRRYTAEDFRSLIARVSRSATSRLKRSRPAALPIAVPEFAAWQTSGVSEAEEALKADDRDATVPGGAAEAPAPLEDEADVMSGAADEEAISQTAPDDSFSVAPLPQDHATDLADEPAPVPEAAEMATVEEAGADSSDEQPQEVDVAALSSPYGEPHEAEDWALASPEGERREIDEANTESPEEEPQDMVAVAEEAAEPATVAADAQDEAEADFQVDELPAAAGETAIDPELQSAETARTLLDIMAMPTGVQPQERAMAGDTLLRLVSRMPVASLVALCDRLCMMDAPPPLLLRRLIQHENLDVSGPLLERCVGISDQDLMSMVETGNMATLRLIARRRHLSPTLTDALIKHGDASVTIAVVRNPGASLSHEAFNLLAETAKSRTTLQAPLATRADTPAPIAFELFWTLPPQLRRYVLSRFLTESANLDRILKIAQTLDESSGDASGPPKVADKTECEALISLIAEGRTTEAAHKLAFLAGISQANSERIIADPEGEPLTVAMKAIGMSRTQSAAAAEALRDAPEAPLRSNRRIAELQNLFDSLSFTKARVLLTYWDWAVEQSGPYSGKTV